MGSDLALAAYLGIAAEWNFYIASGIFDETTYLCAHAKLFAKLLKNARLNIIKWGHVLTFLAAFGILALDEARSRVI